MTGAPLMADMIEGSERLGEGGGGWAWILSDIKSLLETGRSWPADPGSHGRLAAPPPPPRVAPAEAAAVASRLAVGLPGFTSGPSGAGRHLGLAS